MIITTKIIGSLIRFFRTGLFNVIVLTILLVSLVYWIFGGVSFCVKTSAKNESEQTIRNLTSELQRKNPEAAAELARMKTSRNELALAATMKTRYQLNGVDGLARLASYRKGTTAESNVYDLRLAELAMRQRFSTSAQRDDFIFAHAIPLQQHAEMSQTFQMTPVAFNVAEQGDAYLKTLENASLNDEQWRRVRDNPMMVFLMQHVSDQALLDFYDREKDWLDDVLFLVFANMETAGESCTPEQALQMIRENHPYFKNAIASSLSSPENEIESTVLNTFTLFGNYGPIFRYCLDKGQMPLDELLDVMYANQDFFDKHASEPPERLAARLVTIRDSQPAVWRSSKLTPLCLQLYDVVPNLANTLCDKYGSDGIATFLFTKYNDVIPQAAAAVRQYGDLAIYILNRYEKSNTFHKSLKDNELGVRIIPYVAMYEDKGLSQIESNKKWLDKYFDEEGTPREKEWWTFLPGGAAVNVARNWSHGYPNEWSELGWAALDVADAALLIASLGSSSTVSASKSAVTSGAKTIGVEAAENVVESAVEAGVKRATTAGTAVGTKVIGLEVTESIAAAGARQTAAGARAASSLEKVSLFRRVIQVTQFSYRLVLQPVGIGIRYALRAVDVVVIRPLRIFCTQVYHAARSLHTAWAGVDPVTRRIIYRSLLCTGIAITLYYRTIPMLKEQLPKIGENIGRFVGQVTTEVAKTVPAVLSGFVDGLVGDQIQSARLGYIKWSVVALALLGGCFWFGRRIQHNLLARA
ncbi:MAG: hypothetical protein FWC50_02185 [Planctomycetaceae bacterium]|nr:hypothetical protein [Planctomycetaceae bacterium]